MNGSTWVQSQIGVISDHCSTRHCPARGSAGLLAGLPRMHACSWLQGTHSQDAPRPATGRAQAGDRTRPGRRQDAPRDHHIWGSVCTLPYRNSAPHQHRISTASAPVVFVTMASDSPHNCSICGLQGPDHARDTFEGFCYRAVHTTPHPVFGARLAAFVARNEVPMPFFSCKTCTELSPSVFKQYAVTGPIAGPPESLQEYAAQVRFHLFPRKQRIVLSCTS
jgi:hypothetical protein